MRYVKLQVTCPVSGEPETIYYHPLPDGYISMDGCEKFNGSKACKDCLEQHSDAAVDELIKLLKSGNPFIRYPE